MAAAELDPRPELPASTRGFTMAGFIPFGIFAFVHRQTNWGIIGALGVIPLLGLVPGLIYAVYIGRHGRRLAWESGLYRDGVHLDQSMNTWNIAGIVSLVVIWLPCALTVLIGGYDMIMSWVFNSFVLPVS